MRAPHKAAEREDLKKALWYLARASRHSGRVIPEALRKLSINEALDAWQLHDNALTWSAIQQIWRGDPLRAETNLDAYLVQQDRP